MDDEKIVQLYWDRDEQAIPATADKYGAYCTVIARNIVGSTEDAEECVNDTYLKAWNSIPPHRPSVLPAFLGKIVRNLSFNRYKYNTAGKRGGTRTAAVLDEMAELPQLQLEILTASAKYVKVGGTLVYSTCTLNRRENEEVVGAFLKENDNFCLQPVSVSDLISAEDGMVTLYPHVHRTDGFFMALLKRKNDD